MKKIIFIGSGNVATSLAVSLDENNYKILQIFSRSLSNAKLLADKVKAEAIDDLSKIKTADVIIISIKDDFIKGILKSYHFDNIVHTSGSMDINIFDLKVKNFGVLYPIQTFNKEINIDLSETPFLIECNNTSFEKSIRELAQSISSNVFKIKYDDRKKIHLAAVFACNFSNRMIGISKEIMENNNLDFSLIKPLINQTMKKISEGEPNKLLTGPAKRKDVKIIENHIKLIENTDHKKIYELISKDIMNLE